MKRLQPPPVSSPVPVMQQLDSDSSDDSEEETGESKTDREILGERKKASLAKTSATAESQVPVICKELGYLSSGFTNADRESFTKIYLTKSANLGKGNFNKIMGMSIPEEIKQNMSYADFRKVFRTRFFSQKGLAI